MDTFSWDSDYCRSGVEATSPSTTSEEEMGLFCGKLASNCPKKRAGRKKFCETRHPVYRGVRRRNGCRWVCEVREPNRKTRIWLGTYPTAEMAARVHDVAAMALRGRSACLNFADSSWLLPIPDTGDAEDIRKAAAEAAEMFRPASSEEESEAEDSIPPKVLEEEEAASGFFLEKETALGMPALLEDLAEAMLLPPPSSSHWDDAMNLNTDMAFWNHFN